MVLKPFKAPGARLALRTKRPAKPSTSMEGDAEIILDLSRLLSRCFHPTPTGIDRVEYVYARELLARMPDRLAFAAVHPAGGYYGRLDTSAVRQFLAFTIAKWRNVESPDQRKNRATIIAHLFALRPRPVPRASRPRVYLQVSPHHLDDEEQVGAILRAEGAKFVTLVHDVIPLSHPEYARPQGAEEHRRRVRTIDAHAAGIIGNSQATIDALAPHMQYGLDGRAVRVAHFGADPQDVFALKGYAGPERPFFVYIATIEPRKNHMLLLNVWRRLVERLGKDAPVLVMVGRRGWEIENVIDMLERGEAVRDHVVEAGELSDREMEELIAGARAMIMPSFIEGFGMPVVEALSAGVPVICSDISAHREVGGDAPDYLDPIDGLGWLRLIEAYSQPNSPERDAQIARIAAWRGPTWQGYFDIVTDLLEEVTAQVS
ncbi:MAG: glycosyl transferase [Sphingobium sp.]|uniref:Capsular polysaccharide glycosyltransferase biosynthesis protein n=1 Tax=Sphingomonas bisphenolicum TaxID=296544 RepID=A0ABM7G8D6_9SPHN|nr:glycosyltransferase family 1 protein [Sphingomonas bisphenolicum]MBA4090781.1 glycosyl transferase [Sphingobium sp.]BBF71434.1 capsular polysaccharide glycosyltransferase biosynthesis protein [Sphingomonas bisphenolicum]